MQRSLGSKARDLYLLMKKKEVIEQIKGKLIVSCQARPGWPMYGTDIMAAFAMAAKQGGAAAIRATGPDNLTAIKKKVDLPLMGINKIFNDDYEVYITPTYESAREILDVGIDMICMDATPRRRPNSEKVDDILKQIKENYPDVITVGEISTIDEAKAIFDLDFDFISTTLAGFTRESSNIHSLDLQLIRDIRTCTKIPVIAEGMIRTPEDARLALQAGAFAVVVGTAITRPEILTQRFVEGIR